MIFCIDFFIMNESWKQIKQKLLPTWASLFVHTQLIISLVTVKSRAMAKVQQKNN